MSRPRIGIDARLARFTGIGRYVRGLVNALLQVDREAIYVILANPENDPTAVWDWLEGGEAKDEGRLEVVQSQKPIRPYTLAEQAWLPEVARSMKLDLMHVPHWNVALGTRAPVVASFHDATYLSVPGAAPSRLSRMGASFLMKRAARKCARILVPSEATRAEIVRVVGADPAKIATIPLFVDEVASWVERIRRGSCETVSERVRSLPRFVLSVGNHLAHKNLPVLVRAFATVKRELGLRELVLALAGPKGRGTPAVLAAVDEAKAQESVVFLGEVTDRDLGYLYDRAACFATASLAEGFGLSALEGLAAGTPVIASAIPAHQEVLGDAALLVAPEERALAGALARVLTTDALARDLASRGPARAARYSAAKTARATADVYRQALGLAPVPEAAPLAERGRA